ncbi:uracil-DNA glycosylase [Gynuella sunshinyii]|nr:uracil-DNA glycosylase [Gynuella sunshinyii]
MNTATVKLEPSWLSRLQDQFEMDYMKSLKHFLKHEKASGKQIYPRGEEYFRAFDLTPFEQTKVVILGQDPYHGEHQAHGLCFSVRPEVRVPPSLINIYKELNRDIGFTIPNHGYLESWAHQGVLLLNSVLTVEAGRAAAHQGKGWEQFTDRVIAVINEQLDNVVFMLWGSYAQRKGQFIDTRRHLVLKTTHPSPLSAHRGFLGCGHFSQANAYLQQCGRTPVNWQLPLQV